MIHEILGKYGLTVDMLLVLGTLVTTALLFISSKMRVDVVSVMVLVLLGTTRLLPPNQLFSGFSSEAVIALIGIMIISAGLEQTGFSIKVTKWMLSLGKEHHFTIVMLLMLGSGILSGFMRSIGTVALLLPIVTRISSRTGISKSYMLMPIAFCAILGGLLTMIGTGPLIALNSLLRNAYQYVPYNLGRSYEPFNIFDVFPIGIMLLMVGTCYLLVVTYRAPDKMKSGSLSSGTTKSHFKKFYGKDGDIFELKVVSSSTLVNATVKDIELKLDSTLSIIGVALANDMQVPPLRKTVITTNANLAIMGSKETVAAFAKEHGLRLSSKLVIFADTMHSMRAGLCEAVIPPGSQSIGEEVRELHMKRNYKMHVLALCRGNSVYQGQDLNNLVLRPGDTLGMFSKWDALTDFQKQNNFFVLTTSFPKERVSLKKMPQAMFFFVLAISLVITEILPISVGLLLGAVGMIATGVLSIEEAYKRVSWGTVFLLAGLIPLGLVMQTTGTAEWLTNRMVTSQTSAMTVIIVLSIISTGLALFISNVGATVLLVPIALDIGVNVGVEPRLLALTVAIASCNTFIIPTHQVNALIAGPGNYNVWDFFRVGIWMTLIFWVVEISCIYAFYL